LFPAWLWRNCRSSSSFIIIIFFFFFFLGFVPGLAMAEQLQQVVQYF
jgi:hypothetical protein